ncbi:MerR family transcriptional regulator [Paenibacillus cellulositrophicus]|uniref:MerR family transcriptional regulator n=1 Tax=Paenibacillus TaxID=44249 RepID=UPI003D288AEE
MSYSIGEVSAQTGLSIHTLRYYEKEGIMPGVQRNESGIRLYEAKDIEALEFICCLRETGMGIADIKQFVNHATTIQERLERLREQRQNVQEQMARFKKYEDMLNRKIGLYEDMAQGDSDEKHHE